MKILLLLAMSIALLFANDKTHEFASSEDCKACHTQIYDEFKGSMHANSTPHKDPIHKAVWDTSPQKNNQERYACGKCHTPAANNLDAMKTKGQKAMPDPENATHEEGISCAYCHRIKSIEHGKMSNTNVMTTEPKSYYGTLKDHIDSPYHAIVTEGNEHMRNGNVCIGCHSHKMNAHGLNVCSTNIDNQLDGANCVSCHMPKVSGTVSELNERKEHTFHGFAGAHAHSDMLEKYVTLSLLRQIKDFIVNIDNQTSHALLLHPMRTAVLKVSVTRDGKTIKLKDEVFLRVIGKDGKPSLPHMANMTLKDTMIQANEKRSITYDFALQKGDVVSVTLGWFLVNPKALENLKLKDIKVATEFHIFKTQEFLF